MTSHFKQLSTAAACLAGHAFRLRHACINIAQESTQTVVSESDRFVIEDIQSWTRKYFAPALMKPIDGLIARELIRKYDRGGLVLDIACGVGRFSKHVMATVHQDGRLDGLDLATEHETQSLMDQRLPIYRRFYAMDFDHIELSDQPYTLSFSNNGIAVSKDLVRTLGSIRAVTKSGGHLIFNVGLPSYLDKVQVRFPSLKPLPHYYVRDEIIAIAEKTGWKLTDFRPYLSGRLAELYFSAFFRAYQELWPYSEGIQAVPLRGLYNFLTFKFELWSRELAPGILDDASMPQPYAQSHKAYIVLQAD